ncbi:hypothetical protein [Altererythrobacter sp. ZODW24]|uniref:hypothetical protein n=1 Tax=Altererythrobacter sp. ZODW24 TaxID=2185142 RepID=UPI001F07EC29|nr:hypothetical protein [Altererythrobacter sp. ZODW24]
MNFLTSTKLASRALVVAGMSLLLSACFLMPGKFTSTLDLRNDGTFTYSYDGQIFFLGLSKLAEMGSDSKSEEFTEEECYDDDFEERECTLDELANQKMDWENGASARAENAENEKAMVKAMLGGLDPSDPESAQEFADNLSRQRGWDKVEYLGDGMFDVEFNIASRISHDFVFPSIEGMPVPNYFVMLNRRKDGSIRIDAPGFTPQQANPMFGGGTMQAAVMRGAMSEGGNVPSMPDLDGTFILTTDGEILANNTDEGAQTIAGGRRLEWRVNIRTTAAPTALVRIAN